MAEKSLNRKENPKGRARWAWLLALVLLVTAGIGIAMAKYIQSTGGKLLLTAPDFYFTSDLLSDDGTAGYMLNSDTTQVKFTLSSAADALRYSEVDVAYTVSLTKPEGASGELDITQGTLTGTEKTKTITLRNMQPGVTYTVTATGNAGYSRTLTATFRVADNDQDIYKSVTVSPNGYLILTVWTHNVAGDLTITFPPALIPDNTNPGMGSVFNRDADGVAAFEVAFTEYSSQTFRFFGTASVEDFTVEGKIDGVVHKAETSKLP